MGHGLIEETKARFWDQFTKLGFPTAKQEAFQHLPLSKLAPPEAAALEPSVSWSDIEPHLLPEAAGRIVFVDGYFFPEFSVAPKGSILLSLSDAMKSYGLILQHRFAKALKEEKDPFAALSGAYQGRGAFFYLPPKLEIQEPIQILSLFSSEDWMGQRLQLFMGKGSQATFVQTFAGSGRISELSDLVLDANAKLTLLDSVDVDPSAQLFRNVLATLKKDACLKTFSFSEGAALFRRNLSATLLEEGAEVHVKGLDNLSGSNLAHTHVYIEHAAPHGLSRQHFKKALRQQAQSSFEGKIYVQPEAQKTEAYQLNQNLILSGEATAHAKPNLEIFADDVKASHGATFSQLSDEEVFYFQARGVSKAEAKELLFRGFCSELIDGIEVKGFRDALKQRLG